MKKLKIFKLVLLQTNYPYYAILGFIAILLGGAINLSIPIIAKLAMLPESWLSITKYPYRIIAVLVGIFIVQSIVFFIRSYAYGVLGAKIAHRLRSSLYNNILQKPAEFFDTNSVGDILSRLGSDIEKVQLAASVRSSVLVRYLIQVVGGIILMMTISIKLSIAIIILFPPLVLLSIWFGKKLKKASIAQQKALGHVTQQAEETLIANKTVKAFNAESQLISRYVGASEFVVEKGICRSQVSSTFQSSVTLLMNTLLIFLLVYAVNLVSRGDILISDLAAFVMFGTIVTVSFAFLASSFSEVIQATGALERILESGDLKSVDTINSYRTASRISGDNPSGGLPENIFEQEIFFKDVVFRYKSRKDKIVLDKVNLKIAPESFTAIVGESGAGKSAFINLLMGFYEPESGTISLGDTRIGLENIAIFRDHVGYVPQESHLFSISIADNLRLGNFEIKEDAIWSALKAVNLDTFVENLSDGINSKLGEKSSQLSGGQRQRLAIARALLRNPKLLIFDEATSALDSKNEVSLYSAIKSQFPKVTMVVIAHRLSSLSDADHIYVIDEGRVVEDGTPTYLKEKKGIYFSFLKLQT